MSTGARASFGACAFPIGTASLMPRNFRSAIRPASGSPVVSLKPPAATADSTASEALRTLALDSTLSEARELSPRQLLPARPTADCVSSERWALLSSWRSFCVVEAASPRPDLEIAFPLRPPSSSVRSASLSVRAAPDSRRLGLDRRAALLSCASTSQAEPKWRTYHWWGW